MEHSIIVILSQILIEFQQHIRQRKGIKFWMSDEYENDYFTVLKKKTIEPFHKRFPLTPL